ncbi:Histidinol dehydrogenase [Rhodovulum sp. P5]|uniref:histidinol dehydrogenase n=1 Tax=Rhodovulum sp. P5 TaxID=1564506 RepID=UPI0009C1D537|nr:histidinol dehydrogenase [Rhodovulum sp. P5]ARE39292.1 Histidinol dehydrogenase [Rhodovulum sp. P5]
MPTTVTFHEYATLDDAGRAALLKRTEGDLGPILEAAKPIIEAVRDEGDAALARFANQFDKSPVTADAIAATPADFDAAFDAVDREMIEVLEFCSDNVRRFHQAQMPEEMWWKEMHPGVFAGEKVVPIDSVACYVPRGKGSFPSVVMMTTIPAVVAGVGRPFIVTPPGPDGKVDAATLVAARIAGVEEVYKCGGAQGVAAVAYGTETVPRAPKMVGPGSPWVVAAKRLLSDRLDPGTPAGPSESIILADETANGRVAALDLLIESEHGPDSSAWLVTNSRSVAEDALAAIPGYWAAMGEERTGFSQAVLCGPRGGVILTPDFGAAIDFVNAYAPEHLQIHAEVPQDYLGAIRNAGEILLGAHTPICIGNFTLGPNAVLPTNAAALTHSPLGVHAYLKTIGLGHVTRRGYDLLAPKAKRFAEYEGFDAHANAVSAMRDAAFGNEG